MVATVIRVFNWTVFELWPQLRYWMWRLWIMCVVVAFVAAIVALLLQWLTVGFRDRPSELGG